MIKLLFSFLICFTLISCANSTPYSELVPWPREKENHIIIKNHDGSIDVVEKEQTRWIIKSW